MRIVQFEPVFEKEDVRALMETLKDNWITEGRKTQEMQEILKEICGCKHAILLPNGTLALFVGLKVLGIGPGDEVLVPDFTFVGSATSVVLAGARPVFVDVRPDDFNIDVAALDAAVTPRTRAVMPVHVYGQAADMEPLMKWARRRKLLVIEDAAQGIGVFNGRRHAGTFGDVGCMSFFADKTVATGEGGAVLTNDDRLAEDVTYFKNQGRLHRGTFIHPRIGFNFRMTDLQAALGIHQLRRLDRIIERKVELEDLYKKHLQGVEEVAFPAVNGLGTRVPFRINLLVPDPERLGAHLESRGIGVRRFFYPLHKQPCFNRKNSGRARVLVNSVKAFDRGISMPSAINLTESQVKYVCDAVREHFRGARKPARAAAAR